jgi:hypothetical protein
MLKEKELGILSEVETLGYLELDCVFTYVCGI